MGDPQILQLEAGLQGLGGGQKSGTLNLWLGPTLGRYSPCPLAKMNRQETIFHVFSVGP